MSRCKLTNMNLRNIRKSREYQCLLIDLVKTNVIGKSAAEDLLGYTIPAGLLGNTTPATPVDDDEEEETGNTVTLLYFKPAATEDDTNEWLTAEYDLTNDPTGEGIIDFAKDAFGNDLIDTGDIVELDPEYVEGESFIVAKYVTVEPEPETIEPGMLMKVYHKIETVDPVGPGTH